MARKIYIENLPSEITEDSLKNIFTQVGEVQSVKIRTDLLTKRLTRSGIVEMVLDVDAYRAVNCFDGATFKDKKIHLEEEKPLLQKAKNMLALITDHYQRLSNTYGKDKWKTH